MKVKCLLVELPDGRKFFTAKNNQKELLEFATAFSAKLDIVEGHDPELLTLKDLTTAICDQNYISKQIVYKTKVNKKQDRITINHYTAFSSLSSRKKLLKKVTMVRDYIIEQFNSGKTVKIKDIAKKFDKHGVSVSTVYRHVNYVKEMLEEDKKTILKISPGVYKMQ